jgi:hypothetical protein
VSHSLYLSLSLSLSSLSNLLHNHDADYGYIDLDLSFDVDLPEPIYVIYEFVYNKVIVNDKVENEVAVLDVESGD